MFWQALYILILFLIFVNFTFIGSQWPWIRARLLHAKDIPDRFLTDEHSGARTAAFFCFAAIFIAAGLWLTLFGGNAEDEEASDTKETAAYLEVEKGEADSVEA